MASDARDPYDLSVAPFGAFAPPAWLMWLRTAGGSSAAPRPIRRALQNALASIVKRRAAAHYDIVYDELNWRLAPKSNWGDRSIVLKARHSVEADLDLFERDAADAMVFVDAGANVGFYSLAAARRLPRGSRIVAIEPHPETARKFRANLALNEAVVVSAGVSVDLAETALGAEFGTLPLYAPRARDVGSNSLHPAHEGAPSVEASVTPLAALLTERGVDRVDVLKIDVEGFEDRVLLPFFDQASETLWPETVLIEVSNREKWSSDVVEAMKGRGYAVAARTREDLRLTRVRSRAAAAAPAARAISPEN